MVFTGEWNGGERTFNLRPRQRLEFVSMERLDAASGQRVALNEDRSLDDVDEYAFTDSRTLRWRSRLPSDRPFSNTRITYAIHYRLSGIVLKDGERYVLDHDFAFPDRVGEIRRFSLRLSFDAGWQPASDVREVYTAGPLAPGRSYVLTIPLRYSGAGSPSVLDTSRPREVVGGVAAILGLLVLSVLGLLVREQRLGRFEPVTVDRVDADWIRQNILAYPAELVGAAWDQDVGKDEVTAIISRLASEGKLTSHVMSSATGTKLSLHLQTNRDAFEGYERTLIDGLFFDGRTTTSTDEVRTHYESTGYDPAKAIAPELNARVKAVQPQGDDPRVWPWPSLALFLVWCRLARQGVVDARRRRPDADHRRLRGVRPRRHRSDSRRGVPEAHRLGRQGDAGVPGDASADCARRRGAAVVPGRHGRHGVVRLAGRRGDGADHLDRVDGDQRTEIAESPRCHRIPQEARDRAAVFQGRTAEGESRASRRVVLLDRRVRPHQRSFTVGGAAPERRVAVALAQYHATSDTSSSGSFGSSEPAWTGAAGGRSGGAGGGAAWAAAVGGMAAGVSAPSSQQFERRQQWWIERRRIVGRWWGRGLVVRRAKSRGQKAEGRGKTTGLRNSRSSPRP